MDLRGALCALLRDECSSEELDAVLRKMEALPNELDEISLVALLPRYISALQMEISLEHGMSGLSKRKALLEAVQKEYCSYVRDIEEYEQIEGTVFGELGTISKRVFEGGALAREQRIFMHKRKASLREEIKEDEEAAEKIVEFTLIKTLERMQSLQSEIELLGKTSAGEEQARKSERTGPRVFKIAPDQSSSWGSIALGGRVGREEKKKLFARDNGPTMTLAAFAEKMEKRSSGTSLESKAGAKTEEEAGSSEDEKDESEEIHRLRKEDEFGDYNRRGDGNVTGKK